MVAKTKPTHVTLSSISPNISTGKPTLGINVVTWTLCQEEFVSLVENDPAFHLADGGINHCY